MSQTSYLSALIELLSTVNDKQGEALGKAAEMLADTLQHGGLVHLFGSGHSVIPAQDAFPRYGSFVGLHPLTDPRLMWHNVLGPGGVQELLWLERTEGYIEKFLNHESLAEGDVLIVYSHGGRNAAPVEAAQYGKKHGLKVVAVTSSTTASMPAQHSSKQRLADVADVMIDTGVPVQDALIDIPNWGRPVGGSSTIVAMACTHEMLVRTAQLLSQRGVTLPTFVSPTVAGASVSSNDEVFAEHAKRLHQAQQRHIK